MEVGVAGVAYGDESIRRTGVSEPMYLLGAYVLDDTHTDLADALSEYARGGGKLHWRDHFPKIKVDVCRTISHYDASHLVVRAAPLPSNGGEERARQRALINLVVILEKEYCVRTLVLERRQRGQDQNDQRSIALAQRSQVVGDSFRLIHRFGSEERRLWVPDQVIGTLGDYYAGMDTGWRDIAARVRVEKIDPT